MKTILVPIDFSPNAENAARYALGLAADVKANKIIFYNAYQVPPPLSETAIPAMPIVDFETMSGVSELSMMQFKKIMEQECAAGIEVEQQTEFASIANDIDEICKRNRADLIVMGVAETSKVEELLLGTTALSVMEHTTVPVIIVHGTTKYQGIKNVMLTSDFARVMDIPMQEVRTILDATNAQLHVVSVFEAEKELTAEIDTQKELLRTLLKEYNPAFHIETNDDFIAGINDFVDSNSIDLIITIPRRHKLFHGLFKERHSKKLAFHSHIPMMCIHQGEL